MSMSAGGYRRRLELGLGKVVTVRSSCDCGGLDKAKNLERVFPIYGQARDNTHIHTERTICLMCPLHQLFLQKEEEQLGGVSVIIRNVILKRPGVEDVWEQGTRDRSE